MGSVLLKENEVETEVKERALLNGNKVETSFLWCRHKTNFTITTRSHWVMRLAWGPRRLSSKAAIGTKLYPESVTAGLWLWVSWIIEAQKRRHRGDHLIVVTPSKVNYYERDVARKEKERLCRPDPRLLPYEVELLSKRRLQARNNKDFETSDYIRDFMFAHGVKVGDSRVD